MGVCVCLYLSITMLAATYLVYMSKVRWYTVSCRLKNLYCVDFVENVLFRIPYSGKLWQALNLANQSSKCIGEVLIW